VKNLNETYRIIFDGIVRQDLNPIQVKNRLAQLFKVDTPVIDKIFSDVPYVLLRNQEKERAFKYKQAFEQTGALCRLEIEKPDSVVQSHGQTGEQAAAGTFYTGVERSRPEAVAADESRSREQTGAPKKKRIDKAGWQSLGGGLAITTGVLLLPFLSFVFHYILILVHELGHAVFGWLFGYPSVPAFDFMYGGGLTSHQDRKMIIFVIIYLLLAGLFYLFRRNRLTLLFLIGLAVLYTIITFTPLHQLVILFMGHGTELVFGAIFMYRALSGSSIIVPAERPLYAFLGFFVFFMDLRFTHRLMTSAEFRVDYGAAKGGGHWMDFSRIAHEILGVELTSVAAFFFLMCVAALITAYLVFRYKEYLGVFFRKLLQAG
jgi:hypothetical protein